MDRDSMDRGGWTQGSSHESFSATRSSPEAAKRPRSPTLDLRRGHHAAAHRRARLHFEDYKQENLSPPAGRSPWKPTPGNDWHWDHEGEANTKENQFTR